MADRAPAPRHGGAGRFSWAIRRAVAEARQTLTEEKLRRAEKRASMAEATAASLSELALRQQRQLESVREKPPTVNNFSGHFSGGVHPTVTYDYSGVFGSVHGQGRTTVGDNATVGMKQPADTANHNYSGDFFGSSVAGGQATVGDNASFVTKQEPARQEQQSASEQQWAAIGGGKIAVPSAESHGDFK